MQWNEKKFMKCKRSCCDRLPIGLEQEVDNSIRPKNWQFSYAASFPQCLLLLQFTAFFRLTVAQYDARPSPMGLSIRLWRSL